MGFGYPQGSILRPLLFIISSFSTSQFRLFDIDLKIYRVVRDSLDSLLLQKDIWIA